MISGGTGFTSGDTIRLTVGPENGNGQVDDIVITVDTTRGDFGVTPMVMVGLEFILIPRLVMVSHLLMLRLLQI